MPRPLIIIAMLAALAACNTTAPDSSVCCVTPECPVSDWLALEDSVLLMDEAELVTTLVDVGRPANNTDLYYYGLLNQQLESYGAWVQARDAFKLLAASTELSPQQRSLATSRLQFNQRRINWSTRTNQLLEEANTLREQLTASGAERELLEQKLEALTAIETDISTRRAE